MHSIYGLIIWFITDRDMLLCFSEIKIAKIICTYFERYQSLQFCHMFHMYIIAEGQEIFYDDQTNMYLILKLCIVY